MARTKTTVSQMALGFVGSSKRLTDVDTDATTESVLILDYWDQTVEEMFLEFAFPCGTVIEDLVQLAEDPNSDWGYSYRKPNSVEKILRILSGVRQAQDTSSSQQPYKIVSDATRTISSITKASPGVVTTSAAHLYTAGDLIYLSAGQMTELADGIYTVGTVPSTTTFQLQTEAGVNINTTSYTTYSSGGTSVGRDVILSDLDDAEAEYTVKVDAPARWDSMTTRAIALRLASYIAPALSKSRDLAKMAYDLYEDSIHKARAACLNEEKRDPPPESEFITGRS